MNIPFDNSGPNTNTGADTDKVKILQGQMVYSAATEQSFCHITSC